LFPRLAPPSWLFGERPVRLVSVAGMVGWDPAGHSSDDFAEQARQALRNVVDVLATERQARASSA
jgi:enamine deaminase RidA (YjgF/YER057c/UK114 family)